MAQFEGRVCTVSVLFQLVLRLLNLEILQMMPAHIIWDYFTKLSNKTERLTKQ